MTRARGPTECHRPCPLPATFPEEDEYYSCSTVPNRTSRVKDVRVKSTRTALIPLDEAPWEKEGRALPRLKTTGSIDLVPYQQKIIKKKKEKEKGEKIIIKTKLRVTVREKKIKNVVRRRRYGKREEEETRGMNGTRKRDDLNEI